MSEQFSRRSVTAAIDVLEGAWSHADLTAFLTDLGPAIYDRIRSETVNLKNRMSDLKRLYDEDPSCVVDGQPLARILVEGAVAKLPGEPPHAWSSLPRPTPAMEMLKRTLEMDGYTVTDGVLRRILPADIALPETESELMRLLEAYQLTVAKEHLRQAMDTHARGDWAAANGQFRTFFEALTDALAEGIDPSAASVPSGHARRSKLAAVGFFIASLNEWDNDGKGYINALVRRLHPEGPHPGLSDEDDSTFRLHTLLLTATLLLRRFDKRQRGL